MTDTSQQAASERGTDVQEFMTDLNAGMFSQELGIALSDAAAAAMDNGGTGEVKVSFSFSRINGTKQIQCKHKLQYSKPTMRGKASEETISATVLHVGKYGRLSLVPENQMSFLDKQTGEIK